MHAYRHACVHSCIHTYVRTYCTWHYITLHWWLHIHLPKYHALLHPSPMIPFTLQAGASSIGVRRTDLHTEAFNSSTESPDSCIYLPNHDLTERWIHQKSSFLSNSSYFQVTFPVSGDFWRPNSPLVERMDWKTTISIWIHLEWCNPLVSRSF